MLYPASYPPPDIKRLTPAFGMSLPRNIAFQLIALMSVCLVLVISAPHPAGATEPDRPDGLDDRAAISKLLPRAEQGNAEAQFDLGYMFSQGKGGAEQDYQLAAIWFTRAAEQGHERAQYNIALMLEKGWGVQRDMEAALFWYQRAAEKGHPLAQLNIGVMYEYGRGIQENHGLAAYFYALSAQQGNPRAQLNLGVMLANGTGVRRDNEQAMMWLILAALKGDNLAKNNIRKLSARLNRTEMDKAKTRAAACIEKKFTDC